MIKRWIALFCGVLLCGALTSCDSASKDSSSGADTTSKLEVNTPVAGEGDMIRYNVMDFGAKGDGSDDSLCIQAALDYAYSKGGGTVYLPKGTYGIGQTLNKPMLVSLQGDGMWTTTLIWKGADDQAIVNMANEALWGTTVSDMGFSKQAGAENITGIRGGSTMEKYNSAIGTFKNLLFSQLDTGIKGDAEPTGVGIFDCYFENIFCSDCTYGLQLYGSGNTIVHPRMANNEAGLVLDFLNGESFDGVHVIGGIFVANGTDILIPNRNGLRPCDFVGTWFETSKKGIVTIPNAETRVMNLTFRDCMLSSNYAGEDALLDFSNAVGTIALDNCTIWGGDKIVDPTDPASKLIRNNLTGVGLGGSADYYYINDTESGLFEASGTGSKTTFQIPHTLKAVPSSVRLTPASADAAAAYYVTANEDEVTVTFLTPPGNGDKNIAFYWGVER